VQIGLFEDAEERGAVEVSGDAIVVAQRAVGLEDFVAAGFLRGELIERRGRRRGVAAQEQWIRGKE
jgi:hypothetical protein